jgi:hypothetical protein
MLQVYHQTLGAPIIFFVGNLIQNEHLYVRDIPIFWFVD